jgi:hypothetical protein
MSLRAAFVSLAVIGCRQADASVVPEPVAVEPAAVEPAVSGPAAEPWSAPKASELAPAPPRRPDVVPDDFDRPRALLRAQAIHAPDPDPERLRDVVARTGRTRIQGVVDFCVDVDGKTTKISTHPIGDLDVNALLRETVAGWTFVPFTVDGRPKLTCTKAKFDIRVR